MALSTSLLGLCLYLMYHLNVEQVSGQTTSASVKTDPDPASVYPDDDVTLTCQIVQPEGFPDVTEIYWIKMLSNAQVYVANQTTLNVNLVGLGSYRVEQESQVVDGSTRMQYNLTIEGVVREDAGTYRCYAPGHNINISRDVIVYEDIVSFEMVTTDAEGNHHHSYKDGDNVTFDEDEVRRLSCQALGGSPAPQVSIFTGDNNVTHLFQKTVTPTIEESSIATGHELITYNVELKNDSLHMSYMFANKELECRAEITGSHYPPKSIGVNVQLTGYRPHFSCSAVIYASLYESSFHLPCQVDADPPINHFNVTMPSRGESFHYASNQPHKHALSLLLIDQSIDATLDVPVAKVIIERIFPQYFNNYTFEAENKHGRTQFVVQIQRDPEDSDGVSSAIRCQLSVSILLLVFPCLLLTSPW